MQLVESACYAALVQSEKRFSSSVNERKEPWIDTAETTQPKVYEKSRMWRVLER